MPLTRLQSTDPPPCLVAPQESSRRVARYLGPWLIIVHFHHRQLDHFPSLYCSITFDSHQGILH